MNNRDSAYSFDFDFNKCEDEPIHLIKRVQSHIGLLICDLPDLTIRMVSSNVEEKFGYATNTMIGQSLRQFLKVDDFQLIEWHTQKANWNHKYRPQRVSFEVNETVAYYDLMIHIQDSLLILEFEPIDILFTSPLFQHNIEQVLEHIQSIKAIRSLFQVAAQEIKKITSYDRVMIYRFDEEYNGEVIAEAKATHLESFLNLHYPASDIPKQARDLYFKNKVRLIADVHEKPAEIIPSRHPDTNQPPDLTACSSRGVSPIHTDYLKNMGVTATMSIAIIYENKLWGLIACHHQSPKFVSHLLRNTCLFIAQIFSAHLSMHVLSQYRASVIQSNLIRSHLFEQMSDNWNIVEGLTKNDKTFVELFDCMGGSIFYEEKGYNRGQTPSMPQLTAFKEWLDNREDFQIFYTNELIKSYPDAASFAHQPSGVMVIQFYNNPKAYVIWWRPSITEEIYWGGNPNKDLQDLTPRNSFDKWKQIKENDAKPWQNYEIETALALRNDIKDFIIQKYQQIKKTAEKLHKAYSELESFSYTVSHDLRAPLRTINGFTQILMEDYGDKFDDYGREIVDEIIKGAKKMNTFIDDILRFSKISRTKIIKNNIDIRSMILEEVEVERKKRPDRVIELIMDETETTIFADKTMLGQLIYNLISNAIKYSTDKKKSVIEVRTSKEARNTVLSVKDNGIGFGMEFKEKIFGVFSRLVTEDEYEGTGVGLAIVQQVVQKHNGIISVESLKGKGTTFVIKFPLENELLE